MDGKLHITILLGVVAVAAVGAVILSPESGPAVLALCVGLYALIHQGQDAAKKADEVAAKVEEARQVTRVTTAAQTSKIDGIAATTWVILDHVNNTLSVALTSIVNLTKERFAEKPTPENEAAVVTAEAAYAKHAAGQAVVDAKKNGGG